jgi:hypothetical protein
MNKKDLSERDICSKFIGPAVKSAGWDGMKQIRQGVWKSTVGETKTATRRKPVAVIARLRSLLDAYAASVPPHRPDQWMFTSSVGTPIDLGNLVNRVIRPTQAKAGLRWRGYHAFRRGLATTLYSLNVPELINSGFSGTSPARP